MRVIQRFLHIPWRRAATCSVYNSHTLSTAVEKSIPWRRAATCSVYNSHTFSTAVGKSQLWASFCKRKAVLYKPIYINSRLLHKGTPLQRISNKDNEQGKSEKNIHQKTAKKVQLFDENEETLGLMSYSQAKKLAEKKNFKLVLLENQSINEPVYQFMTGKHLAEEQKRLRELKRGTKKKELKALKLASKISEHDLGVKLKQMKSWLEKGHEIKVTVKNASKGDNKGVNEILQYSVEQTAEIAEAKQVINTEREMVFYLKPIEKHLESDLKPLSHKELLGDKKKKTKQL